MSTTGRRLALWLAAACLFGCAMERHREQIREGLLTRGLHRDAFLKEWGPPSRTFSVQSQDAVLRTSPYSARWERAVLEVWEYQTRETCLTFDGVRLVAWEQGRSDCTPKPPPEPAEEKRARRPPAPYPPYPPYPP